jgi:hypothetical protein
VDRVKISLPRPDGTVERHEMLPAREWPLRGDRPRTRVAYAAAHVVADRLGDPALAARRMSTLLAMHGCAP